MSKPKKQSVKLSADFLEKVKKHGQMGDTYETVLERMLKHYESQQGEKDEAGNHPGSAGAAFQF